MFIEKFHFKETSALDQAGMKIGKVHAAIKAMCVSITLMSAGKHVTWITKTYVHVSTTSATSPEARGVNIVWEKINLTRNSMWFKWWSLSLNQASTLPVQLQCVSLHVQARAYYFVLWKTAVIFFSKGAFRKHSRLALIPFRLQSWKCWKNILRNHFF